MFDDVCRMIKTFRDLDVYKEAYELMLIVHGEVKKFPVFEKYDLAPQCRRCSKSSPLQLALVMKWRFTPKQQEI